MSKKAPTYNDMIKGAIIELKQPRGSSLVALKKYILGAYNVSTARFNTLFKAALKKGVAAGDFVLKGPAGPVKLAKPAKKALLKPKPKKKLPAKPKAKTTKPKAKATTKKAAVKKDGDKPAVKKAPAKKAAPKKAPAKKAAANKATKPKTAGAKVAKSAAKPKPKAAPKSGGKK